MRELVSEFVPVADEVHRLQKGKTADARLFQGFCEEGHYGGRTKPTDTRQGIYACTASGRFLASVNTRHPDAMVRMLEKALANFAALEEGDRVSSPELLEALGTVQRAEDRFPVDGLVLRVASKDMPGTKTREGWHEAASNLDWAWFQKSEARDFLPEEFEVGQTRAVPKALVERLVRFHLLDNVRGQTTPFGRKEVRIAKLESKIECVEESFVDVRFSGATLAMHDEGPWARGFETKLEGVARWDRANGRFTRFELVAKGDRWGRTQYNARAPERDREALFEREPIAVLFEVVGGPELQRVAPAHFWGYGW
ncbi:MAG: hypothetical protein KDC95_22250 [Planctomycetes bacterium]|nr:hypothetical protein [Planctomycetota bacterium]